MYARLKDDFGFSLVETLVALVIFAAVSTAGVSVLSGYQKGQNSLLAADDFTANVQTVHSLIKADLENILKRPVRDEFGGVEVAFASNVDEEKMPLLRFVRGGHFAAVVSKTAPAIQRVEYWLKDNMLIRRSYDRPDRVVDTSFRDRVILRDVEKLSLRFQKDTIWLTEWSPVLGEVTLMPDLVEMSISLTGRGGFQSVYAVGGQG